MRGVLSFFFLLIFSFTIFSCYRTKSSDGGGNISKVKERTINTEDIALPEGYQIEAVATGLTFPTGIAQDEQGLLYVVESGYAYGEVWTEPRLLRVTPDGEKTVMVTGNDNGPWNGIDYYNGQFYIAEGGQLGGGKILRVDYEGMIDTLLSDLPSVGDHHTNGPKVHDGYIYFSQGTATNSAIVGKDNQEFGWLDRQPHFHDIPCKDITLTGQNFETDYVLSANEDDRARTGAFVPFNTTTSPGEVIEGSIPCTGAILRMPLEGGEPELVAWGLRNAYGMAFTDNGQLYATENAYDNRGSRPVWGAGDVLWEIIDDHWYGFPDFSAGKPIDDDEFKAPGEPAPAPLLQEVPTIIPQPTAILGVHSSSNGLDFSKNDEFGYKGQAFIAQFGDMAPQVGKVMAPVGFKVVRVDPGTGQVSDFVVNKGRKNGPASWQEHGGIERPNDILFSADGQAMYIVDFGIVKTTDDGPEPQKETGVIWKVSRKP
ncbi:glucose dehydrogenase [Cytophagaceae bacterium ABcell3]|nr:glucose dehydrogenase [Cytophagaceae bacterium ABcell3]